jgi:hypothetical protein
LSRWRRESGDNDVDARRRVRQASLVRPSIVVDAGGARTSPDRGGYILGYALPKRQ